MEGLKQLLEFDTDYPGEKTAFVYHGMKILVVDESRISLPDFSSVMEYYGERFNPVSLGICSDVYYSAFSVDDPSDIPSSTRFIDIRQLYHYSDEKLFHIAGFGSHIADWDRNFRYCGRCGTHTRNHTAERSKVCPSCGHISYPRVSPAVICSVSRGDEILLARGKKFSRPVYSVLAGFVEPGETLEEAVKREVMEETSISVKNIRYFGNQPWPYSSSMMIAFTAEYESGEIKIQEEEILDAGWFRADNLPLLPTPYSIARSLIMNFAGTLNGTEKK